MKSLVFWGRGTKARARAFADAGARLLLWSEAGRRALVQAGVPFVTPREHLGQDAMDACDEAAFEWTKAWGKRPLIDGASFRELYQWDGFSLWWFAELYLHHSTRAPRWVRLVETLHRLLEAEAADEVEAVGLEPEEALLLRRAATARGLLYHGPVPRPRGRRALLRVLWHSRWYGLKTAAGAVKARLVRPPKPPPSGSRARVLFVSHAAFWRERRTADGGRVPYEHYFDRLIPEVDADPDLEAAVVAVGPRAAFRRRGLKQRLADWLGLPTSGGPWVPIGAYTSSEVVRAVRRVSAECRQAWRRLRASPAMAEAFSHRGVRFDDLCAADLAGTLLLQLPWAVRSYEEARRAIEHLQPAVICLYAESSGWGRAVVAASRAAGVGSVGIQHGILYPGYYSYRHEADEADSPIPDRTAVFGDAARRFLIEAGHYPEDSLEVTGSPKFDALLAATRGWDREALRGELGVAPDEKLLVVASRYRPIRDTYQSIGTAFAGLVAAVEARPGVRLLVKPHPAEPADEYRADIQRAGARRAALAPPGRELLGLLFAADALVTVESLSATEALVLGRPVLILNAPTNLRAMVEQGVALAVDEGDDPAAALEALLFDTAARERLDAARDRYLEDLARGVDGGATRRIVSLLRRTAEARRVDVR